MSTSRSHRIVQWLTAHVIIWTLILSALLVAAALFLAPYPGPGKDTRRWAPMLALAIAACAGAIVLGRAFRRQVPAAATQLPETGSSRHAIPGLPGAAPNAIATVPAVHSLDKALGATHMREVRAHVDLLCTMATVERMGPALLEDLKHSGISTLALQAAISAQVVRRILAGPSLGAELRLSGIQVEGQGFDGLKEDLDAIAVSLAILGERMRDESGAPMQIWTEIVAREKLMMGLAPIDSLLVQSTLLLSGVSNMARMLAGVHGRTRKLGLGSQTKARPTAPAGDVDAALGPDIPASKLN